MKLFNLAALPLLTLSAQADEFNLAETRCRSSENKQVMAALQQAQASPDPNEVRAAAQCRPVITEAHNACMASIKGSTATAAGASNTQIAGTNQATRQGTAAQLGSQLSAADQQANALCAQKFSSVSAACSALKAKAQIEKYAGAVRTQCSSGALNAQNAAQNLEQVKKADDQMGESMPPMSPPSAPAAPTAQEGYQSDSPLDTPAAPPVAVAPAAGGQASSFNFDPNAFDDNETESDSDGLNALNNLSSSSTSAETDAFVAQTGASGTGAATFTATSTLSPEDQLRKILSNFAAVPSTGSAPDGAASGAPSADGGGGASGVGGGGAATANEESPESGAATYAEGGGSMGGGGSSPVSYGNSRSTDINSGPGITRGGGVAVRPGTFVATNTQTPAANAITSRPAAYPSGRASSFPTSIRKPERRGVASTSSARENTPVESSKSESITAVGVALALLCLLGAGFAAKKYFY